MYGLCSFFNSTQSFCLICSIFCYFRTGRLHLDWNLNYMSIFIFLNAFFTAWFTFHNIVCTAMDIDPRFIGFYKYWPKKDARVYLCISIYVFWNIAKQGCKKVFLLLAPPVKFTNWTGNLQRRPTWVSATKNVSITDYEGWTNPNSKLG